MSDITIKIENLGKRYRYGEVARPSLSIRDDLVNWMKGLTSSNGKHASTFREVRAKRIEESPEYFWALKDIHVDIHTGEVVGIIGRNGAGKSTMLKILSRITPPTTGKITYHGRIASLLEVGTGFHRDLTGRENVFLNGSILGMKRREIQRKFDEIVAFAEVEKFIDTPVKFYSSGMYVRLAFAVAAHLEPEILIIDEVLAVGDAAFQKKCLGKMGDVARQGRTVLFVSHNTGAIMSLCDRALWLNSGQMVALGPTKDVVQHYLKSAASSETVSLDQRKDRSGDGSVRAVSLRVDSVEEEGMIRSRSRLKITIGYKSESPVLHPRFRATVSDFTSGVSLFVLDTEAIGGLGETIPAEGTITCVTEPIGITPGRCYVDVQIRKGRAITDELGHAGTFDVALDDSENTGKAPTREGALCLIGQRWTLQPA